MLIKIQSNALQNRSFTGKCSLCHYSLSIIFGLYANIIFCICMHIYIDVNPTSDTVAPPFTDVPRKTGLSLDFGKQYLLNQSPKK